MVIGGISTEKFVIDQKLDYKIKRIRQMNNSHYKECMGLMLKGALTSIFLFLFKSSLGLEGKERHFYDFTLKKIRNDWGDHCVEQRICTNKSG